MCVAGITLQQPAVEVDDSREGQLLLHPPLQIIGHLPHLPAPRLFFLHLPQTLSNPPEKTHTLVLTKAESTVLLSFVVAQGFMDSGLYQNPKTAFSVAISDTLQC